MLKHILLFVLVAMLLQACKQQGTEEKKYTIREHDSIVKAKHKLKVITEYKKANPNDTFYFSRVDRLNLFESSTYYNGKKKFTVEHWDYSGVCSQKHFLYVYDNKNKLTVRLPDLNEVANHKDVLVKFGSDLTNMVSRFDNSYFVDSFIKHYIWCNRLGLSDFPAVIEYKKQIIRNSLCSKECQLHISEQIKLVEKYLHDNDYVVYRSGFYFLSMRITQKDSVQNHTSYSFELLNPECYCEICF